MPGSWQDERWEGLGDSPLPSFPPVLEPVFAQLGFNPFTELERIREAGKAIAKIKRARAEVLASVEAGEAQFGPRGNFDNERKTLLHGLMEERRSALLAEKKKVVESYLDSYAHAAPKYIEWLMEQHKGRVAYHQSKAKLAQFDADLEEAYAELEYAKQRVRLNEELLRYDRNLANLER